MIPLDPAAFREKLMAWYRLHARKLPWRGATDPYAIWVSEVMLQQTRVAAVLEHYQRFMASFPNVSALAAATESEVLAAWSGLGYYRRARLMHRAAKVVAEELSGVFPKTAAELRLLPGIGDYTCAAIASIAFGERAAVLDGNVERVLLRLTGRDADATAVGRGFLKQTAAALMSESGAGEPAGNHNQAMMELGATICLPRAPLCLQCPVFDLCNTRGEHTTAKRPKAKSRRVGYLLQVRGKGTAAEVLLEERPGDTSLMAGMYELPSVPLDADTMTEREPVLRLRHSITDTVYTVEVHAPDSREDHELLEVAGTDVRRWTLLLHLEVLPLTGLARKVLRKMKLMT